MPTPSDAKHPFDDLVPAALIKHPETAKEIGATFAFKILGEGGGEWTVDLASTPPTCMRGGSAAAPCTVEVEHEDFKSMLANPQAGMQLYFQGKLRVTGDPMLATRLQQFFQMASQ